MRDYTILIADDDQMQVDVLQRELQREGYATVVCYDGEAALGLALTAQPDLILLDVMMPKRNGWEVCRELRAESSVPILMLTARGEEMDRVMGLRLGADDYIIKPFGLLELLARVDANLRRVRLDGQETPIDEKNLRTVGPLTVDLARRTVLRDGQPVELAHREFDLFAALLAAHGAIVTRGNLLDQVWGEAWVGEARTLDVHIRRLRYKLEKDPAEPVLILTARGVGYRVVSAHEITS